MLCFRWMLALAPLVAGCRPAATASPPSPPPSVEPAFDPEAAVSGALAPDRIAPPPDRWWKTARPCPRGTKVVERRLPPPALEGRPMESQTFRCERPDGTQHGAHTLLLDGEVALTGHYKNGEQHGHLRSTSSTPPSHSDSLYDEGIGIGTWRATEGELVTIKEHREGGEIHFTQRTADGRRIAEGVLVDGLRQGPWIFGEGEEQRTTSYDAGTAEGATGITGDVECDAGVQRWRECLAPKRGATRYQMADWLSFYVLIWERVPEAGDGRPMCVAYMPLLAQQLAAYGCAAS